MCKNPKSGLSGFEQALAAYAVLERHLERLPAANAIYPHEALTSFAMEKQFIVKNRDTDNLWLGLGDRTDMEPALRLYRYWKNGVAGCDLNATRARLEQEAVKRYAQKDKTLAAVFSELYQDIVLPLRRIPSPRTAHFLSLRQQQRCG